MYASVRERCVYVEFSMHVFLYLSFSRSLRDKQCAAMLHIFRLLLSLLFNLLAILVDLFYNTKKFYFLLSLYRAAYRYVCVLVSGPIDAFIACCERRRSASVVCQIELNRFLVCASQKYHLIFFWAKKHFNKWAGRLLFFAVAGILFLFVFLLIRGSYALSFTSFSSFTIAISHLSRQWYTYSHARTHAHHTNDTDLHISHCSYFRTFISNLFFSAVLPLFPLFVRVFWIHASLFRIQWNNFHFNENEYGNEWIRKITRGIGRIISFVRVSMVSFSCRQNCGDFVIWCVHAEHA